MAITVKHTKVSTIPDGDDTSVVRPSDWNADHQLVGTVPVSNGGTGASTLTGYVKGNGTTAMTAATTIPNTDITGLGTASTKDAGVANGVATLDSSGTVPLSQIPALGDLNYQGTWNATTNSPTLTSSVGTKGFYYVVSVAGTTNLNGITDWQIGDWAVYNGSVWQKIDNTDAVTSVNGYTGTVVLTAADVSAVPYTGATGAVDLNAKTLVNVSNLGVNTTTVPTIKIRAVGDNNSGSRIAMRGYSSDANSSAIRVSKFRGTVAAPQAPISGDSLGKFELAGYGTTSADAYPQVSLEGVTTEVWGATARGAKAVVKVTPNTTTTQVTALTIDQDSKATFANTVTANGTLLTGNTGTVTSVAATAGTGISVSGSPITTSGTLTITNTAPDQTVSIASGTGISATGTYPAFTVTNTAPDQTVAMTSGTGISVTGTYPNFTVTNTAPSSGGTVTSVSGTAPVVSSGGTTPAISMAKATTSVDGYLSSTDWTTFNNKQPAGTYVNSVSGTTGRITSTGGVTPVIDLASGIATAGTTGSSTLIPVVTIDTYGRVTGITTASNPQGTVTSVAALTLGTTGTDLSSTVATGTTTPVITLQVPTASASNRGALSSTDWSTFNGKQATLVSGTNIKTVAGVSLLGAGDVGLIGGTYGGTGVNNGANTITVGGNVNYSGAFTQTWTRTANTSLTLPVSGTLISSATAPTNNPVTGTPSSSNFLRGDGTWASPTAGTATYSRTSFTATVGQTTFSATYTVGYVEVYQNGVLLNSTDYTATNGTSVVLAIGASTGDIIETIAYATTVSLTPAGSTTQVQYNNAGTLAGSANMTFDGTTLSASGLAATGSTTGSSTKGAISYGTLGYSDVNHLATFQSAVDSYSQIEIQNTNATSAASSDVIVANNNTTASTFYGDFGMNSSAWAGTAGTNSLGAPNMVYLTSTSADLTIGTTTSNVIRFVTNGGADKLIFDASGNVGIGLVPTGLDLLELGAGTTAKAPLGFTSGSLITVPDAGSVEFDGNNLYFTTDTSQGRTVVEAVQQFYLSAAGSALTGATQNYFGSTSAASLAAASTYDIECYCYFLKTTSGTMQWIPTFSSAITVGHSYLEYTPVTGFTTTVITGAMVVGEATQQTTTVLTHSATAALTTAVYHIAKLKIRVTTNLACNFRLNGTISAGTITPQAGSFYTVRKVVTSSGNFVA